MGCRCGAPGHRRSASCSILGLIVAEVLSRNFFNVSLYFAWEFSAYLMGAAFLMGAAYALRAGAQIRVNVLLENLPKPVARLLDIFATICGVLIAAYLTWALGELTWLSYVRESRSPEKSEILRWITQFPLALGSLLFTLQTIARLGRLLRGEPGDDLRLAYWSGHRITHECHPDLVAGSDDRNPLSSASGSVPRFWRCGVGAPGNVHEPADAQADRCLDVQRPHLVGHRLAAAVHPDGRAAVPHAVVAVAVLGHRALDELPAGPAVPHDGDRLLDVCRHLGLVGRDDAGGGPHHPHRAFEPRLRQRAGGRQPGRRRHAGLPDPAVDPA